MADADRIKIITSNLEATFQSLKQAAANISGLLAVGQAVCEDVQAYNVWALAVYNGQIGMLQTLTAAGEPNVPPLPQAPTLFAWNGVSGQNAINFDCSVNADGTPATPGGVTVATDPNTDLEGVMDRALRGPTPSSVRLGLDTVSIVTTDQYVYNPSASPTFATLTQAQAANAAQGLGNPLVLLIVIAAILVGVSIAVSALMKYLDDSQIQEQQTARTQIQANAFATYTAARLQCYQACVNQGTPMSSCVQTCGQIEKPVFTDLNPFGNQPWGWLQWTGFTVVVGVSALVAWKLYQRKRETGRIFPELHFPDAFHLPEAE